MTTIAVKGDCMACDSKMCVGDRFYTVDNKIVIVGDALVGCSGNANDVAKFLEWLANPEKEKPEVEEFDALVLNTKGLWHYANDCYSDRIIGGMWACGSGGDAAFAAMFCGKTPAEAVSIASKCDKNTGGPVRVAHLNKGHPSFTKRK